VANSRRMFVIRCKGLGASCIGSMEKWALPTGSNEIGRRVRAALLFCSFKFAAFCELNANETSTTLSPQIAAVFP
jgi:hypothetical protein